MRFWVVVLIVWGSIALAIWATVNRYATNTAGGRFYKTDRWTGKTLVVEKDGQLRTL